MHDDAPMIPLNFKRIAPDAMGTAAQDLLERMTRRRSVRQFSDTPIEIETVRRCIDIAAQAPSGANKQPWTFVLVTDPALKAKIRAAAEAEERTFYGGRAPQDWLDDLRQFGTDPEKPFLERAPALIILFSQTQGSAGEKHYYVRESVGIACGMLLMSLHLSGLGTLTHTPSPMNFLHKILERPPNERAFLVIPVGYPEADCTVPDISRKSRSEYLIEKDHSSTSA